VASVASINQAHMGRQVIGNQVGRATVTVAYDEQICVHGLEVIDGIQHGFALFGRGNTWVEIDNVGGKPFRCDFKSGAGTGAGFEEKVDDGFAAE
jgi:hypothetical protein